MIRKIITFFLLLGLFDIHDCADLKVKIEDVFIDFINYTYIDEETFYFSVDYESETKSSISIKVDIIEDIPEDVRVKVKVWGRTFGQYTLPTGINMDVKFCQGLIKDLIQPYMAGAGITACPPTKGTYESQNISTEIVGLPISLIPGLHFLIEFETYVSADIVISKARTYIFVS